MGEVDKKGTYMTKIPFSDAPYFSGEVCIKSDDKRINRVIESSVRQILRDIYYGRIELE